MTDGTTFRRGVRMESSRDGRFYYWAGRQYWSVTTIIGGGLPKPFLVNWAKKFVAEYAVKNLDLLTPLVERDPRGATAWLKESPYRDRDEKGELGSECHDAAESFVLGRPYPEWRPEVAAVMKHFIGWLEDYAPEFDAVEAPVFSPSQDYAGTLDAIATFPRLGGRRLLIDYKTGKDVYPEVALQLAAYRYSESFIGLPDASEAPTPEVDGCAVVHLTPKGYRFIEVRADEEVFRAFLYVREVFRFQQELSKGVIGRPFEMPDEALNERLAASVAAREG